MKLKQQLITLFLVVIALMSYVGVVYAGADSQPVEWSGNPGAMRWSLTSIGMGSVVIGDKCDSNDYVMRVNKNASADPDRYRIYSFNGTVQRGFTGKSPIGHLLGTTTPYLCLGFRDTWNGGGPLHVARNMFVWVQ